MWKTLKVLKKNLALSIIAFMVLGVLVGSLTNPKPLKQFIIPLTIMMVYPMMVTLNIKSVFSQCDVKTQMMTQGINFIVMPLVAFGIGQLFFAEQPLYAVGLLLIALIPTSGMTISWTGFAKGNMEVAIKMTVIGLTMGAILTPLYINVLMGEAIEMPFMKVVQQISLFVFVPMVAGYITQRGLIASYGMKKYKKEIKPKFPLLSIVGVLGIVFAAMALKAKTITGDPSILLFLALPLILFYLFAFAFGTFMGKTFLNRENAIALVYGTSMRNLSIALALALIVFPEQGAQIALIIAIAYIFQVPSAAWYLKVTDKVFGAPAPAESPKEMMGRPMAQS
jgi:ACR3 family arsenite efflux pump ArsB